MKSLRTNQVVPDSLQPSTETMQAAQFPVQSVAAAHPGQVFFNLDIRRALQMHKALAIGIFAFVLLLVSGYVYKTWNNYFAEAIIYVQPAPPRMMETGVNNRWPSDSAAYESYIQQQIHNVTRPDVLEDAVRHMPGWKFSDENDQMAAARLGRKVEVGRVGAGYQIYIRSRAKSAEKAAQMSNALAASFVQLAKRELRSGDPERLELLREERNRIQKELATDRAEQEDLNKKLGIAAVSGNIPDPVDEQLTAIRGELVRARTERDQVAARLTAMSGGTKNSAALDATAEEVALADPGIVSMKTALNQRRSALVSQMANLTPNHPLYKQDAEELAKIDASIEKMTKEVQGRAATQIKQKLKGDLERTAQVEAKLNGELARLTSEAGSATPRLQRFNDLGTDIQRLQTRYAAVDEQFRNLSMENSAPGAVYLSQAAPPPLDADHAKVLRNALIALVVGLVLAFGGALVAHNLDQRVIVAGDVERVLGFPPMAQLPDLYEVGTGVSEEYMLRLAAAIEHAYQQGSIKSCIFTGVAPGAGATTVCKRVTSMLEAMGRQTVQVDAAGTQPPPAMADGAGEHGRELVPARTSRSSALLQQMAKETGEDGIVLTDTAPLLVSGETEYLARFVDSAIVVIESGVTTRRQLRDVANTLQRLEVRAAGFVLNRISLQTADSAFRESVRAVERHVDAQTRAYMRESVANRPVEQSTKQELRNARVEEQLVEPADLPRSAPVANAAVAVPTAPVEAAPVEPAIPQPVAPAPAIETPVTPLPQPHVKGAQLPRGRQASRSTEARVASANIPESPTAPKPRVDVPPVTPIEHPAVHQRAAEPIISAAVPKPTALPKAAAPVWPAAKAGEPVVPVSPAAAKPETPDFFTPKPPAYVPPVSTAVPVVPPIAPVSARPAAPFVPAQSSAAAVPVPAPVGSAAAKPAPTPDLPDLEDLPYSAASRLGGLRNLLVTLGLKTLNKDGHEPEVVAERAPERPAERPVFAEPYRPSTALSNQPAPEAVTAQPEFLPPRVAAEPVELEKEQPTARPAKQPKPARWDTDDIETLPSWRGQYRKKR